MNYKKDKLGDLMLFNTVGATQGNFRDQEGSKGRKCCKCMKFFKSNSRVDCVDLKGRERTFCFKCYDKELKKSDVKA